MKLIDKLKKLLKRVMNTDPGSDAPPMPEPQILDVQPKEEEEESPYSNIQSSVTFMVTKQGGIDLNISWAEDDDITAKNLSTLLYMINCGAFEENCANLLVQIAHNNNDHMSFVREVIEEWNKRKKVDPLVKPSEVFQFGTQPMGQQQ